MPSDYDSDNRGSRVLFEAEYSYRRIGVMIGGVLFSILGVGVLILFFMIDMDDHSGYVGRKYIWPVFGLGMAGVGGWHIWAYSTGNRKRLIITDEGLHYGSKFWEWNDIARVGRQESKKEVTLYIRLDTDDDLWGTRSNEILLPLTPAMTMAQYRKLSDKLYDELSEEYPDLEIK